MTFKFIDLFAGIGGFHIALHNLGGECVSACEIDKNARITYELNHNNRSPEIFEKGLFFDDIKKIDEKLLPEHNILCGGFPCQAFSIAGYRKGFSDDRGDLFFDIVRIAEEKKPEVVFLENVKNIVSHNNGETIQVIVEELNRIGYYVKYQVLNSYEYGGVPQNRERVYIIGFRCKDSYNKFEFPTKVELKTTVKDIVNQKKVGDTFYYDNHQKIGPVLKEHMDNPNTCYQWRRHYVRENKKNLCPTLTANMGTGGHNVPIILTESGIRKITPQEALRFQGFPNDFSLPKIANSHLYKQAGNSVSVPVLENIGKEIIKAMNINSETRKYEIETYTMTPQLSLLNL